jgi:hypothetical protein
MTERYILVTHPNGRCYGHLEWGRRGTELVVDHCQCGQGHPGAGCARCGATDLPVIGHAGVCPGAPEPAR